MAASLAAVTATLLAASALDAAAETVDPLGPVAVNDSFLLQQDHPPRSTLPACSTTTSPYTEAC